MTLDYVIIQAGGAGTRLEKYTYNKPKGLVSVDSLPMIFHTFRAFKGSKFIIIGDYKYEVLKEYLRIFSGVDYVLIKAQGKGTCGGLKEALNFIPQKDSFLIIWSDLILPKDFTLDIESNKNYIGISKDFECRWSYKNEKFIEEKSKEFGVAGFFILNNKKAIHDVPASGEFVRYLKEKNLSFEEIPLYRTKEFGEKKEYENYIFSKNVSRPFNKLYIKDNKFVKEPIDKKGYELSEYEKEWYRFVITKEYDSIPKVYDFNPLTLEKIEGFSPSNLRNESLSVKRQIIDQILLSFEKLHNTSEPIKSNFFSLEKEYYIKTFERITKVFKLIPFSTNKEIKINKKWYLNPFYIEEEIKNFARKFYPDKFYVIHGDPTFSNILIKKESKKVYLIDPRGYFGFTKIYGDRDYDYAKLYYSVVGNYDMLNQKKFSLKIEEDEVNLEIESNNYEELEDYFFENIGKDKREKIKFLHSIIWLSLTTYAWDDYDTICASFYNGTMKLGDVL